MVTMILTFAFLASGNTAVDLFELNRNRAFLFGVVWGVFLVLAVSGGM